MNRQPVLRTPRLAWLAWLVAASSGCTPAPAADPTTFHELSVALSQIACEAQHRCCGTPCSGLIDLDFNRSLVEKQDLLDRGKLVFDARQAARCLVAQRSALADCDASAILVGQLQQCDGVLRGTAALGKVCRLSSDCVPGAFCDNRTSGTCQALVPDGGSCMDGKPCEVGLSCGGFGKCLPKATRGNSCFAVECDDSGEPLVCNSQRVCVPPLPVGARCASDLECLSGVCGGAPMATCGLVPFGETVRGRLCK